MLHEKASFLKFFFLSVYIFFSLTSFFLDTDVEGDEFGMYKKLIHTFYI